MSGRGNLVMLALVATAFPVLSGCLTNMETYYGFEADDQYANPGVFPGNYVFSGGSSSVLQAGKLQAPKHPDVTQLTSTLPAYSDPVLGPTTESTVLITIAVWRPLNATGPVPVIVDAGPYYEQGTDRIYNASQTTPFSLKNFLPHGYAVAQVAVRGTGTSGGCMDLMGPAEVHDLDQAITWLAEQPWSNGNVAMMGASYDGSTPWEVASTGNPHLKTIIPTAGLPDIYGLMFHNGSAEGRGPIMHNQVYWGFGFSQEWPYNQLPPVPSIPVPPPVPIPPAPDPWPFGHSANGRDPYQDRQNFLCPEVYEGSVVGQYSGAFGDRGGQYSQYWARRDHRQAVLDNYKGSIFLIHGFQDWNVEPHSAIPFNVQLREAGFEMKEWYGQWAHAFPDSTCGRGAPGWVLMPCRIDYAEVLLRWLNRYLKDDMTQDLGPSVEVQDNLGFWHILDSYPPVTDTLTLHLSSDGTLNAGSGGAEITTQLMVPPGGGASQIIELKSEPLAEDLHISGLIDVRLPFSVTGQGGDLAFWLMDEDESGKVRAPYAAHFQPPQVPPQERGWRAYGVPVVGHGAMNVRYYAGGDEPQVVLPNERYTAKLQLEALDVMVPKGHRLTVWVFQYVYQTGQGGDRAPSTIPGIINVVTGGDEAVIRLPVLPFDAKKYFAVPGIPMIERENFTGMHILKPIIPTETSPFAGASCAAPPLETVAVPTDAALCPTSKEW